MVQLPNIVLVLADQQPYRSMGCTGSSDARTPHLDQLAARGVLFENHFTTNPVCMPARASLLSGQYIKQHGVWDNGVRMPLDTPNIASLLKRRGYQTAHFGKLHLEPVLNRVGLSTNYHFDLCEVAEGDQQLTHDADAHFSFLRRHDADLFFRYICEMYQNGHEVGYCSLMPEHLHLSTFVADRACDFVENRLTGEPFFLSVGFFDPHHAFNPCARYWDEFEGREFEKPNYDPGSLATRPKHYRERFENLIRRHTLVPERMATTLRGFHAMMAHVDASVGRLIRTLERCEGDRETIVIYSSDHGEFLGEHGFLLKGPYLLDQLLRVPLIIAKLSASPGELRRESSLTSSVDLLPTLLGFAGESASLVGDGRRLLGADFEQLGPARRSVLAEWEGTEDGPEKSQRCVRTADFKLITYASDEVGELYDLANDPLEFTNLYQDPEFSDARAALRAELGNYYQASRPLLRKECGW